MSMLQIVNDLIFRQSRQLQREYNYDFRRVLETCLDRYASFVEYEGKQTGSPAPDLIVDIRSICNTLNEIIDLSYSGKRSAAYGKLSELISSFIENGSVPFYDLNCGSVLYRMRVCDLRRDLRRKDLFHIPFSQTRNIETQRYSVPGFPSLYLAKSIYGCWEEMHRPPIESALVAAFKTINFISLLDLRIPDRKRFDEHVELYMKWLPVIIASSIPVVKDVSPFKPEYIIPQMILEYVVENGARMDYRPHVELGCMGIIYTSVFSNIDFFELDEEWDNIVMPAQRFSKESDYCPVLHFHFHLTEPTCYEYEVMKGTFANTGVWDNGPRRINEGDLWKRNYYYSVFSRMEEVLNTREFDDIDMPPWQN